MLIESLNYDLLTESKSFASAVDDLAEVAPGQMAGDFVGSAMRTAQDIGSRIGASLSRTWEAEVQEGLSYIGGFFRKMREGLGSKGQDQLERELMRALPGFQRRAEKIGEAVASWQQRVDDVLQKFGGGVAGTGYDPITPEELPPAWRTELKKLARGSGLAVPEKTIVELEKLVVDALDTLRSSLEKSSPDVKARLGEEGKGFEMAVATIEDAMATAKGNVEDATMDLERFAKMEVPKDEQNIARYLAMANDVIESIDQIMEAAERAALTMTDVLADAATEVPAHAQRRTATVTAPFGHDAGPSLRGEYEQAAQRLHQGGQSKAPRARRKPGMIRQELGYFFDR